MQKWYSSINEKQKTFLFLISFALIFLYFVGLIPLAILIYLELGDIQRYQKEKNSEIEFHIEDEIDNTSTRARRENNQNLNNNTSFPPSKDKPRKGIFSKSISTTWWWTKFLLLSLIVQLGVLWLPYFSNDYNYEMTRVLVNQTVEKLLGTGGAIFIIICCVFFISLIINLFSAPFKKH